MRFNRKLRVAVIAWTCLGLASPQISFADTLQPTANLEIPVVKATQDVVLQDGELRGAIVDANGRPVAQAPVILGVDGKAVKQLRTGDDGRFKVAGLKQGMYQVVSHGGAHNYNVWDADNAPVNAKQGVIHVANPQIARGAGYGPLLSILSNPIFLAAIVAAAIAIPLAIDEDDAS